MKKIEIKYCPKCKKEKTVEDFYRDRIKKDGLFSICKDCTAQASLMRGNITKQQHLLGKLTILKQKQCVVCREIKSKGEFQKNLYNRDGLSSYCKQCRQTKRKKWDREERKQLKLKTFSHYGGKCVCCGEKTLGFLQLHHKNRDGEAHRRKLALIFKSPSSSPFYRWLKRNNYPINPELQVLCRQCHWGIHKYGQCPHKQ